MFALTSDHMLPMTKAFFQMLLWVMKPWSMPIPQKPNGNPANEKYAVT